MGKNEYKEHAVEGLSGKVFGESEESKEWTSTVRVE